MALRVAAEGEKPPTQSPAKSVSQAAKSKDPRELLVAMRDRIADAVSRADCQPRDLASLTKRLQDIVHDIAVIDALAAEEQQQREARQAAADDSASTYDASAI